MNIILLDTFVFWSVPSHRSNDSSLLNLGILNKFLKLQYLSLLTLRFGRCGDVSLFRLISRTFWVIDFLMNEFGWLLVEFMLFKLSRWLKRGREVSFPSSMSNLDNVSSSHESFERSDELSESICSFGGGEPRPLGILFWTTTFTFTDDSQGIQTSEEELKS